MIFIRANKFSIIEPELIYSIIEVLLNIANYEISRAASISINIICTVIDEAKLATIVATTGSFYCCLKKFASSSEIVDILQSIRIMC